MSAQKLLINQRVRVAAMGTAAVLAAALAGCGVTHAISSVIDPAAQAADVTASAPGYRMAMAMQISTNGSGVVQASGSGRFTRSPRAGALSLHEHVAGRDVTVTVRVIGSTMYLNAGQIAGGQGLPGGKHWVSFNLGRAVGLPSGGMSSMSSDPSQFMRYLKAAGARATPLGHATIRGVPTRGYRVVVDLQRYVTAMAPPAERPAAQQIVHILKAATGRTTMPYDIWIDQAKRLRRMRLTMTECAAGHKLGLNMTVDLYDFGRQPTVSAPAAADTYDMTSKLGSAFKQAAAASCGTSA